MLFKKCYLLFLLCLLTASIFAEIASGKDTVGILDTALKNKKRLNYKTVAVRENAKLKLKIEEYFYNKAKSDGSNYTRFEEHAIEGLDFVEDNTRIIIKNIDGVFEIFLGKTVKKNLEDKESFAMKDLPTHGETAEYELADILAKDVPCYKITKRVKLNLAAFENYKKFLPEWYINLKVG